MDLELPRIPGNPKPSKQELSCAIGCPTYKVYLRLHVVRYARAGEHYRCKGSVGSLTSVTRKAFASTGCLFAIS